MADYIKLEIVDEDMVFNTAEDAEKFKIFLSQGALFFIIYYYFKYFAQLQ